jgi:hypothetical protein
VSEWFWIGLGIFGLGLILFCLGLFVLANRGDHHPTKGGQA